MRGKPILNQLLQVKIPENVIRASRPKNVKNKIENIINLKTLPEQKIKMKTHLVYFVVMNGRTRKKRKFGSNAKNVAGGLTSYVPVSLVTQLILHVIYVVVLLPNIIFGN